MSSGSDRRIRPAIAQCSAPREARRLLVISYHFPPDGSIGGLRWAGITKYLARFGWKVAVVTAASPVSGSAPAGVNVESCSRLRTLNDFYRWVRRVDEQSRAVLPSSPSVAPTTRWPGLLRRLRSELAAFLVLPDESRGWLFRAALHTRSLLRQFEPQVLVSSGPPHSAHLAARMATIGSSVRWLIDLRDPWGGPHTKFFEHHAVYRTRIAHILTPRLERLAFRAAHGVIANTAALAEALAARYPDLVVTHLPNGVDPECLPTPAPEAYPGLGIAHAGTLYGSRDLGPVLRAFRLFLEGHQEAERAGSKLRIAGHVDPQRAFVLADEVASLGLEQSVEMLGLLPRTEALNMVARSRLAVVLAQEQDLMIPAKLYESVAMGVSVLVVARANSATAVEGQRLGAIVRDPSDVAGIAGVLERLWQEPPQRRRCPVAITYEAMAPLVDELLRGNGGRGVSKGVGPATVRRRGPAEKVSETLATVVQEGP